MERPYFEEIAVGATATSAARTITEADVVQFAMLSGDWNPLHVDAEFARSTPFGQRVAHGVLGIAVSTGLRRDEPLPQVIAFLSLEVAFKKPIFIGDTVHLVTTVVEKRETKKPDQGVVVTERRLVNQRGEIVQEGRAHLLVRRRL